jgi:hypothetical protein
MSGPQTDFEKESRQQRPSLLAEMFGFLAHNKKWWLLPILICLGLLTLLAIFASTGAAPFIYTLF